MKYFFILHRAALEYCGKKKGNDFVTVGKKFEYKNFKMLSDVCFDCLIRIPYAAVRSHYQTKALQTIFTGPTYCYLRSVQGFSVRSTTPYGDNSVIPPMLPALIFSAAIVSHILPFMVEITHIYVLF